jgi:hypothetical protein
MEGSPLAQEPTGTMSFTRRDFTDMRSILILALLLCLVTGADADRRRALIMKQTVAGGGAPSDFTTGLSTWLKADDLSLGDGDPVSTWTASIGNDFTQASGQRPTFQTSEYNSLPTVRFDGTDDSLSGTVPADTTHTLMLVFRRTSGTAAASLCGYFATEQLYNDTTPVIHFYQDDATAAAGDVTAIGIIIVRFNTTSSADLRAQSGSWVNFDPFDNYAIRTTLYLGDVSSTASTPMAVDICEVRIYDSALSDSNVNIVGTYLGYKWGFSWTNL